MHRGLRRIMAAMFGSACFVAGCGDRGPAGSTTQAAGGADETRLTLPEFYGVYAVGEGGKLIEITASQPPAVVPAATEFIVYEKGLATAASEWSLTRLTFGIDDAASPGAAVAIRRKGVTNQPEMMRILPTATLVPGQYQIRPNERFVVGPDKLRGGPIVGQWIDSTSSGTGSAVAFNSDGTYEIVLITMASDTPRRVERETGTWTLDAQRLTTTSTKGNDGRPPGSVDVLNVVRLSDDVLVLQDPQKPKSRFHYVRGTPPMMQMFLAATRGEGARPNDMRWR